MIGGEINEVRKKCGCGINKVYKVARELGRLPYGWEVLLETKRRGRPVKYVTYSKTQKEAIAVLAEVGNVLKSGDAEFDGEKLMSAAIKRAVMLLTLPGTAELQEALRRGSSHIFVEHTAVKFIGQSEELTDKDVKLCMLLSDLKKIINGDFDHEN